MKSARPIIRPNVGFWKQMVDYERRLRGHATITMIKTTLCDMPLPDVYSQGIYCKCVDKTNNIFIFQKLKDTWLPKLLRRNPKLLQRGAKPPCPWLPVITVNEGAYRPVLWIAWDLDPQPMDNDTPRRDTLHGGTRLRWRSSVPHQLEDDKKIFLEIFTTQVEKPFSRLFNRTIE